VQIINGTRDWVWVEAWARDMGGNNFISGVKGLAHENTVWPRRRFFWEEQVEAGDEMLEIRDEQRLERGAVGGPQRSASVPVSPTGPRWSTANPMVERGGEGKSAAERRFRPPEVDWKV
jgi:hypothetical protein